MQKTHYWYIFGIISAILIIFLILAEVFWNDNNWIFNTISLACGLASLAGVVLALIQIGQAEQQIKQSEKEIQVLSNNTDAINTAVMENRKQIRDFISLSEISHLIGMIQTAQLSIRTSDYGSTLFLLQQIIDNLNRINDQFNELLKEHKKGMTKTIRNVNDDIESLTSHLFKIQRKEPSSLIPEKIHSNLESSREIIVFVENSLRKEKI